MAVTKDKSVYELEINGEVGPEESTANSQEVLTDVSTRHMIYGVSDSPPIHLTVFFGLQQALLSLSLSLTVTLLIAEAVCAGSDEILKTRLLCTTMFVSGLSTILMVTIGVRLPLYQGPATAFVIPLAALGSLPEWKCSSLNIIQNATNMSLSENVTSDTRQDQVLYRVQMMQGSLMVAAIIQTLLGMTGLIGKLLRYIGPITVIPVIALIGFSIYKTAVKFCETQWGVAFLTCILGVVLSLYLGNNNTPIPFWTRDKGFHIIKYPLHQVFSLLFAIIVGWTVSVILTAAGVLSDDPSSKQFLARTDSRSWVIQESQWFYFPYPGQFGPPDFSLDVFITFIIATLISIIDSIGDYYTCARICKVAPPPAHAVNRGIFVEGIMGILAGTLGVAHATTSYGPNLGALGITRVASLRVFVAVGIIYMLFGILGKFGAFFITIPYSVLGGITIISFGIFIGVNFSNMIFIDLHSTRNLSIIGLALLLGLMIPYWIAENPNGIETGITKLDEILKSFLGNPTFPGGMVAFILDNTIPGTYSERGLTGWLTDLKNTDKEQKNQEAAEIYNLPFINNDRFTGKFTRHIPFLSGYVPKMKIKV